MVWYQLAQSHLQLSENGFSLLLHFSALALELLNLLFDL